MFVAKSMNHESIMDSDCVIPILIRQVLFRVYRVLNGLDQGCATMERDARKGEVAPSEKGIVV